nr:hypothetical protein [Bacteroidales bacterium]
MTFAYLILAHKNISQLKRLINTLDHKDSIIIIHLDRCMPINPFLNQLNNTFKGKVFFTPNKYSINRLQYSMIEATMSLIDFFFKLELKADYIHLLSGQDYPVKSREVME